MSPEASTPPEGEPKSSRKAIFDFKRHNPKKTTNDTDSSITKPTDVSGSLDSDADEQEYNDLGFDVLDEHEALLEETGAIEESDMAVEGLGKVTKDRGSETEPETKDKTDTKYTALEAKLREIIEKDIPEPGESKADKVRAEKAKTEKAKAQENLSFLESNIEDYRNYTKYLGLVKTNPGAAAGKVKVLSQLDLRTSRMFGTVGQIRKHEKAYGLNGAVVGHAATFKDTKKSAAAEYFRYTATELSGIRKAEIVLKGKIKDLDGEKEVPEEIYEFLAAFLVVNERRHKNYKIGVRDGIKENGVNADAIAGINYAQLARMKKVEELIDELSKPESLIGETKPDVSEGSPDRVTGKPIEVSSPASKEKKSSVEVKDVSVKELMEILENNPHRILMLLNTGNVESEDEKNIYHIVSLLADRTVKLDQYSEHQQRSIATHVKLILSK